VTQKWHVSQRTTVKLAARLFLIEADREKLLIVEVIFNGELKIMPRPIKPIPRACPNGCGHMIKQKYFKTCGRCRAKDKRLKREQRKFRKELKKALAW